jgi:hypothetical protein
MRMRGGGGVVVVVMVVLVVLAVLDRADSRDPNLVTSSEAAVQLGAAVERCVVVAVGNAEAGRGMQ